MNAAAIEATRRHNAMEQALARALARPKRIVPAPAPAPAPAKAPAPIAPRFELAVAPTVSKEPVTLETLSVQIAGMVSAGTLDLSKTAPVLADALCTDTATLSAAMVALGYVRTRRGISAELYFTKRNTK